MAEMVRHSPLTGGNEVSVIPNGIDVERFAPTDKAAARAAWRLPQDRKIILFGALNSTADPRKGFRYLDEALQMPAAQGWGEKGLVVVFGANRSEERRVGKEGVSRFRSRGWTYPSKKK